MANGIITIERLESGSSRGQARRKFFAELAARNSTASAVPPKPLPGTLGALIVDYRASAEFITLEPRTRADY
jgi:hypothetical protein